MIKKETNIINDIKRNQECNCIFSANKIHVSVTTYRHLMKCGGYVLKQRSSPEVKVYMVRFQQLHRSEINIIRINITIKIG